MLTICTYRKKILKQKWPPTKNVTWTLFQFVLTLVVFLQLAWYFFYFLLWAKRFPRVCETCISSFRESHELSALCISCKVDRLRADMLREAGLQVTARLPRKELQCGSIFFLLQNDDSKAQGERRICYVPSDNYSSYRPTSFFDFAVLHFTISFR